MVSKDKITPLIVIVGPSASGKSAWAMNLAEKFNGEIISADSRAVYKGLDIGTDKPNLEDRKRIKHYLIDITTPEHPITAADFKNLALKAIDETSKNNKLPIFVGGSGLYIDSVIFDFNFRRKKDLNLRKELEKLKVTELQARVLKEGLKLPLNEKNLRHLIRLLESQEEAAKNLVLRPNTLIIGIKITPSKLRLNIARRVETMFNRGLEQEVLKLSKKYGWELEPLRTIGYREFRNYYEGKQDIAQTKELIVSATVQYAKRQMTWFKRNKDIHWVEKQIQAVDLVTTFLNK